MDHILFGRASPFSNGAHTCPRIAIRCRWITPLPSGIFALVQRVTRFCNALRPYPTESFFFPGCVCFRWIQALFGLVIPYSPMHFGPFQRNKHPIQLINRFSDGPHTISIGSALAPETALFGCLPHPCQMGFFRFHCITQWTNVFFLFRVLRPLRMDCGFCPTGVIGLSHGLR